LKECNQCGRCCTKYGGDRLAISEREIELWEIFRPELYDYIRDGKIWINPDTGEPMKRCPWLRQVPNQDKYICDIYLDRPDDCKSYPVTIDQMVADECEMLEVKDLVNPALAQNKLNKIMADSRPPFELKSSNGFRKP